ncbi:winged helix-turn-helix domain-containing protein [Thalassomonas sp. RHCl1]|uniref:winged helix-turn-helix domain-containing protein n=1 Tax=Thalassomonas sp. RHCl1 TaxID=2995320 RepID=UPI00248B8F16|nr:winged helix-turn-helix domain-containing protein [Thalassomonas sp. RHCl1]
MDAVLPDLFLFDDWRIDCVQNLAWRGKRRVSVEPKAMMVLQYLAARPGIVVTREELFSQFWPNQVVTQDALNRVMSTLRRAFNDNACHPKYIATVRKVGYKLVAPVMTLENPRTKALLELHGDQELLSGQMLVDRDTRPDKGGEYMQAKPFPGRYLYLACFLVLSLMILLGWYTLMSFPQGRSVPVAAMSVKESRSEVAAYAPAGEAFRNFAQNLAPVEQQMPGLRQPGILGERGEIGAGGSSSTFLNDSSAIAAILPSGINSRSSPGFVPEKGDRYYRLLEYHSPGRGS